MPKKGKPDSYWQHLLHEYAQGRFKFATGQKPGKQRWKDELQKIDRCLKQKGVQNDLNGNRIQCSCGFHKERCGSSDFNTTVKNSTFCEEATPATSFDVAIPATSCDVAIPATSCDVAMPAIDLQQEKPLKSYLPNQFQKIIHKGHQKWVAECILDPTGKFKDALPGNWYHPPEPKVSPLRKPEPYAYFAQKLFVWAPMRMWGISFKCTVCKAKLTHGGLYQKAREVVDFDSRYYMVGECLRCSSCKLPICPWSPDLLKQLDPCYRAIFPATLSTQMALDNKCLTLLKRRSFGNTSTSLRETLSELHSEVWGKRVLEYLSACTLHKKGRHLFPAATDAPYESPPPYRPLPLAQWFETVHNNEVQQHEHEMRACITSTFGKVLKIDSTKKITKKLAGNVKGSASWMTNVSNEIGEVLNCVFTKEEGTGLLKMCQGIVTRYQHAGQQEPKVIYVDRDCCSTVGRQPVLKLFSPWNSAVRLDIYHYMRRFDKGLASENHPLYESFCTKLSSCIFEWEQGDVDRLRKAKATELCKELPCHEPSTQEIASRLTSTELARHCRRRTRGVEETQQRIQNLLDTMWDLTDATGRHLVDPEAMTRVWDLQKKHLPCIQDVPGLNLYTKTGSLVKGGERLDVLRCARGTSSLESFHNHQCQFIPGNSANATHSQMYMLEGCSRWNISRRQEGVDMASTSKTTLFDVRLMANLNRLSREVLGEPLLSEFVTPGKPTDEKIAVEYLLDQTDPLSGTVSFDLTQEQQEDILPEDNMVTPWQPNKKDREGRRTQQTTTRPVQRQQEIESDMVQKGIRSDECGPFLPPKEQPHLPVIHNKAVLELHEPSNRQGEVSFRKRKLATATCTYSVAGTDLGPKNPQPSQHIPRKSSTLTSSATGECSSVINEPEFTLMSHTVSNIPMLTMPTTSAPAIHSALINRLQLPPTSNHMLNFSHEVTRNGSNFFQPRQREWRRKKADREDEDLRSKGQPPKRRRTEKDKYQYICHKCGQYKSKQTGHSQVKGKWYCPMSGETIAEWKTKL